MKKLLILMLALVMVLCMFVACGDEEETPDEGSTGTSSSSGGVSGGDDDCEHTFVSKSKVEATCKAEGSETFECSKCGATKTDKLPVLKTHDYKVVDETEATCEELAKIIKECQVCGDKQEFEDGQLAPHKGVEVVKTEPTCDTDGAREYECEVCGTTMFKLGFDKVIPKLGHTYEREGNEFSEEAGVTFVAGNCDTEGRFDRVCQDCGYDKDPITREEYGKMSGYDTTKYDDMEVWGHDYSVFVGPIPASCTTDGYDEYKCSRCDATNLVVTSYANGHTYEKGQSAVEGTHFVVTQAPTCIVEGKKAYKCTVCGEVATDDKDIDTISCIPHDTSNRDVQYLTDDRAADCLNDAYKVYKCCADPLCQESEKVVEEGTALGHDPVVSGEQTCATEGKTPYSCSRCSATWLDGPVDENIKHKPETNKVLEATCINNAVYRCSICEKEYGPYEGDEYYADGFAHGIHQFVYNETVAPTCSSIGYKIYACVADGACTVTRKDDTNTDMTKPDTPKAEDIVARVAHNFDADGNGVIDVSPDGRIVCSVCMAQYRDVTTEVTNGSGKLCLGCGKDSCECGLSVEWNGYVSPTIPDAHMLSANTEVTISSVEWKEVENKGDKALAIGNGMIIIDGEDTTTYTIKIYDKKDGELLKTVELTGDVALDLYEYAEVGQVAIKASTAAVVFFYAAV